MVVVDRIVAQPIHRCDADVGTAVHRTFFNLDPLKVVSYKIQVCISNNVDELERYNAIL